LEAPAGRHPLGQRRQLHRARAAEDLHRPRIGARALESIERPVDELVDDEVVEARGAHGKPPARRAEPALVHAPGHDVLVAAAGLAHQLCCPPSRNGTTRDWARMGTTSTMCRPYPATPTMRRGWLVSKRSWRAPSWASTWAPSPKSRS